MEDEDQDADNNDKSLLLSRSSLYAPLSAYHQTLVNPADHVRNNTKSAPKSIQESSLLEFVEQVSAHHHRTTDYLHTKNTSAKSLNMNDVKDRLLKRTLTLVGGGYNSLAYSAAGAGAAASDASRRHPFLQSSARARKRRRRSKAVINVKLQVLDRKQALAEEKLFLSRLNLMWNEYARTLLGAPTKSERVSSESDGEGSKRTHSAINSNAIMQRCYLLEWAGARVRVVTCHDSGLRSWIGQTGIIISHSTKQWRVIFHYKTTSKDGEEGSTILKSVSFPKNATLEALLPWHADDHKRSNTSPTIKYNPILRIVLG